MTYPVGICVEFAEDRCVAMSLSREELEVKRIVILKNAADRSDVNRDPLAH